MKYLDDDNKDDRKSIVGRSERPSRIFLGRDKEESSFPFYYGISLIVFFAIGIGFIKGEKMCLTSRYILCS